MITKIEMRIEMDGELAQRIEYHCSNQKFAQWLYRFLFEKIQPITHKKWNKMNPTYNMDTDGD